jgi:hypothetical protein
MGFVLMGGYAGMAGQGHGGGSGQEEVYKLGRERVNDVEWTGFF